MKIETKFDIGQEVYYLDDIYIFNPSIHKEKAIMKGRVFEILITDYDILYNFNLEKYEWISEDCCFRTKEEAEAKLKESMK